MFKFIRSVITFGQTILREVLLERKRFPYVLEEINICHHNVIIRCAGMRTMIKISLEAVLSDMEIINGLSPKHASLLGGAFGRVLRVSLTGKEAFYKAKKMSFLLSDKHGRYKVVFQNRDGKIGYYDKKTKKEFIEHPLTLATNDYLISEFDASQACYIGILAGISVEKAISEENKTGAKRLDNLLREKPLMRIV